eukprot:GEMP01017230.1.p1 GENE.GEMP01017230.1~~GEMP01017230.1.p1  ORF type:complete len:399 (+),score=99.15 GEMP01017230.1:50-1246(+)
MTALADDVVTALMSRLQPVLHAVAFEAAKQALAEVGFARGGTDLGVLDSDKQVQVNWNVSKPAELKQISLELVRGAIRVDRMNVVSKGDNLAAAELVIRTPHLPGPFFGVFRLIDRVSNTSVGPDLSVYGHVRPSIDSSTSPSKNDRSPAAPAPIPLAALAPAALVTAPARTAATPVLLSTQIPSSPASQFPTPPAALLAPCNSWQQQSPDASHQAPDARHQAPHSSHQQPPQQPLQQSTAALVDDHHGLAAHNMVGLPVRSGTTQSVSLPVGSSTGGTRPEVAHSLVNLAASQAVAPRTTGNVGWDCSEHWHFTFEALFAAALARSSTTSNVQERELVDILLRYAEERQIKNANKSIVLDGTLSVLFRQQEGSEVPLSQLVRSVREFIHIHYTRGTH